MNTAISKQQRYTWQTQFQFCDIFFFFKSFEKIILQGHGPIYFI